jgi:dihydrolipoamide dehydrogenase
VSAFVHKALTKQGMTIHVSSGVETLEVTASGVNATIKGQGARPSATSSSRRHRAEHREYRPEALGVKTERGHIVTDGYGRTSVEGVYAIGDVTGPPWLAHKASHEGVICVEAIAGNKPHPMETGNIPGCTYSRPQVASVGFTEAKAKEVGYQVKVGKFPFIGNGKAIALGEAEGFVKTVFDAKTASCSARTWSARK